MATVKEKINRAAAFKAEGNFTQAANLVESAIQDLVRAGGPYPYQLTWDAARWHGEAAEAAYDAGSYEEALVSLKRARALVDQVIDANVPAPLRALAMAGRAAFNKGIEEISEALGLGPSQKGETTDERAEEPAPPSPFPWLAATAVLILVLRMRSR